MFVSIRLSLQIACQMDFKSYPFDWQLCPLEMESYAYKTSDIVFIWDSELPPVDISPGLKLPQHRMRGHFTEDCSKQYSTGRFTCLSGRHFKTTPKFSQVFFVAYFLFDRVQSYYLLQIYLPSALIVMVSWISFFIPIDTAAPRTTLNITTVLTTTTMWMSIERFDLFSLRAIDLIE